MTHSALFLMMVFSAACSEGREVDPTCVDGESRPCTCDNGNSGEQSCDDGLEGYGPCQCASEDAGPDADSDADEDIVDADLRALDTGFDADHEEIDADTDGDQEEIDADPEIVTDADHVVDADDEVADADVDIGILEPPPLPTYSNEVCPELIGGSDVDSSVITGFLSGTDSRDFRFIVPPSYDGTSPWPLMFAWHWLNASSRSFVEEGELESAAEEMQMLIIVPDALENDSGDNVHLFNWPFDPLSTDAAREKELVFFDDLLACVSEQYLVDPMQVHGVGVSAGALWLTYLSTTERINYLATVLSLSGGLAEFTVWTMEYAPQDNKFPALVLWGGPLDYFPPINFEDASTRYREALIADSHFVVTCTHGAGHAVPPIDPPADGGTRFRFLWSFMLDHPFGLPPGTSPWQTDGLPTDTPDWCEIATP